MKNREVFIYQKKGGKLKKFEKGREIYVNT